jgi:hypothetical protein
MMRVVVLAGMLVGTVVDTVADTWLGKLQLVDTRRPSAAQIVHVAAMHSMDYTALAYPVFARLARQAV